jgi:hypothetical protein
MRIATEISEDGGRPTEGWFRIDDPVGLEERIDEGAPRRGSPEVFAASRQVESLRSDARRNASTNFPRKTRLRTFTGRKKPAYWG